MMPRPILSYPSCIVDTRVTDYYYCLNQNGSYDYEQAKPKIQDWQLKPEDVPLPSGYRELYRRRGVCPFCNIPINKVFTDSKTSAHGCQHDDLSIWLCRNCNWWASEARYEFDDDWNPRVDDFIRDSVAYGIVKKFNSSDLDLPIDALLQELARGKDVLYEIHPTKLEQLAQYVFSAFYSCKVEHVGKSHDGGVDLILVLKDDPVLVQVKRRSRQDSIEGVDTVREFLGAMFIKRSKRGILLSTASSFSRPSQQIAKSLLSKGRLKTFQLIDFCRFCEMLDVIHRDGEAEAWRVMIEKWHQEGSSNIKKLLPSSAVLVDMP